MQISKNPVQKIRVNVPHHLSNNVAIEQQLSDAHAEINGLRAENKAIK